MNGQPNTSRARKYAVVQHGGQTYNEEVPYEDHLDMVVEVGNRFGFGGDQEMGSAMYLHDTIEDTDTSYTDIHKRFGEGVAELVYAVTSERGRNRKEKNQKTYPKLREAGTRAICLKLMDRIANVQYGLATPNGKVDMYRAEYPEFRHALHPRQCPSDPRPLRIAIAVDEAGIDGLLKHDPLPAELRLWDFLDKLLEFES